MSCKVKATAFGMLAMVFVLCGVGRADAAIDNSLMGKGDNGIVGRKETVYFISNIPQHEVYRHVARGAAQEPDRCKYLPLSQVGSFGRRSNELLPYNWRRKTETVVVVDRAAMDEASKAGLQKLMPEMFPTVAPEDGKKVRTCIQNSGRVEWQVFMEVPDARWLEEATNDLWSIPGDYMGLRDDCKKSIFIVDAVVKNVAIISNEPLIGENLKSAFDYSRIKVYSIEEMDGYLKDVSADCRVVALNWNGREELVRNSVLRLLPKQLHAVCMQNEPDRMGLTGWLRFCREARYDRYNADGVETWLIRAPTTRMLALLADDFICLAPPGPDGGYTGRTVYTLSRRLSRERLRKDSHLIKLHDLSHIKSLAVGTYIASPDPDRKRLVLQQQIEEAAGDLFQTKVQKMYSAQDWGGLLQQVLGDSDASPFRSSGGAQKIVSASQADALLVLWVKTISPQTLYRYHVQRLTPAIGKFNQSEPSRPGPNDKYFLGPKKYPGETEQARASSYEYQRDLLAWKQKYERWRRDKAEWEEKVRRAVVNYSYSISKVPCVSGKGFLKLIDLRTQNVLWTSDVNLDRSGQSSHLNTVNVRVIGDDTDPEPPRLPPSQYSWNEETYDVGQDTLVKALRTGAESLKESALWYSDIKPWNRPRQAK